jgi:hypothetical protein
VKAPLVDYEALGKVHPKLARGQVWCTACGHTERTDSGHNLRRGWPKCCGFTMTIDSPEERHPGRPLDQSLAGGEGS